MRVTQWSVRGRLVSVLFLVALAALVSSACGGSTSEGPDSPTASQTATPRPQATPSDAVTALDLPVTVAVTLPLFEEFAREAAGSAADVISLIPPGTDPVMYEMTTEDIDRLADVDFFYFNGLGLDDHLGIVIEANRDDRAFVIPFSPNIRSPGAAVQTAADVNDEAHLWLDPKLASVYVEIVADEFIIYDGVNRADYDTAFIAFDVRMTDLLWEIEETISAIPTARQRLVTQDDDFTHFARRFGLEVVADADSQAGDAQAVVDGLAQLVMNEGIPAVFSWRGHDPSTMEAVALAAGVPHCFLYTDILDESVSGYEEMMRANAAELVACLAD